MKKRAVAKKYAKALLDLAKEEQAIEGVAGELQGFVSIADECPGLIKSLSNRMYPLGDRASLLEEAAKGLGLSDMTRKFLHLLMETGDMGLLRDVSGIYRGMADELSGRLNATVVTAAEPDETLLAGIKDRLSGITGMDVVLSHETDPEVIGGVMLKVGNTVVDGTLKGQLARLREKLLEGAL